MKIFKIRCSEITSEAVFVLSPTGLHGRSNTVICHNTRQSSQGISVTTVNLVRVGSDEVGIL